MKKALILLAIILSAKLTFAQKNFEGEIDYRMFGLADGQKDTTIGSPYKVLFGKHAIKIESFTAKGVLWSEEIVLLDSLKVYVVDHGDKTYNESWKYKPSVKLKYFLPWGMNKVLVIHTPKKIAGYETFINRLTTEGEPKYGNVDLAEAKPLYFKLPPNMTSNLFFQNMLLYDNHIMLAMKVAAGVAPHTQLNHVATKVEAREIDPSEFEIPAGYKLIVMKSVEFH